MKLEEITLERLLKDNSFITVDDINLPNDDKYIISATYYGGHPEYRDISVRIGVLSQKQEYENFHSMTRTVVLLMICGTYERVPVEVGSKYFEYAKKYLIKQGYDIYPFIQDNTGVFNTLSDKVDLVLNSFHGSYIAEDIYFFHPKNDKGLFKLYRGSNSPYTYLPQGKPTEKEIVALANRLIGYKGK